MSTCVKPCGRTEPDYGRAVHQAARSALARAVDVAGPFAVVESVRRLNGGTHADTHLVRLSNPDLEVVLHEFPIGDAAAENEARVLQALNGLDGLTPRLLDSDVDAAQAVRPWGEGNCRPLGRDDLTASDLRRRHTQWTTLRTTYR
jgi:hypothetical protein